MIYVGPSRNEAKILQPFNEGDVLSLMCEVRGGVPSPSVTWYLENEPLDATYKREYDDVTVNYLDIATVTRNLLRARLVCRANNTRLVEQRYSEVILDVNCKSLD